MSRRQQNASAFIRPGMQMWPRPPPPYAHHYQPTFLPPSLKQSGRPPPRLRVCVPEWLEFSSKEDEAVKLYVKKGLVPKWEDFLKRPSYHSKSENPQDKPSNKDSPPKCVRDSPPTLLALLSDTPCSNTLGTTNLETVSNQSNLIVNPDNEPRKRKSTFGDSDILRKTIKPNLNSETYMKVPVANETSVFINLCDLPKEISKPKEKINEVLVSKSLTDSTKANYTVDLPKFDNHYDLKFKACEENKKQTNNKTGSPPSTAHENVQMKRLDVERSENDVKSTESTYTPAIRSKLCLDNQPILPISSLLNLVPNGISLTLVKSLDSTDPKPPVTLKKDELKIENLITLKKDNTTNKETNCLNKEGTRYVLTVDSPHFSCCTDSNKDVGKIIKIPTIKQDEKLSEKTESNKKTDQRFLPLSPLQEIRERVQHKKARFDENVKKHGIKKCYVFLRRLETIDKYKNDPELAKFFQKHLQTSLQPEKGTNKKSEVIENCSTPEEPNPLAELSKELADLANIINERTNIKTACKQKSSDSQCLDLGKINNRSMPDLGCVSSPIENSSTLKKLLPESKKSEKRNSESKKHQSLNIEQSGAKNGLKVQKRRHSSSGNKSTSSNNKIKYKSRLGSRCSSTGSTLEIELGERRNKEYIHTNDSSQAVSAHHSPKNIFKKSENLSDINTFRRYQNGGIIPLGPSTEERKSLPKIVSSKNITNGMKAIINSPPGNITGSYFFVNSSSPSICHPPLNSNYCEDNPKSSLNTNKKEKQNNTMDKDTKKNASLSDITKSSENLKTVPNKNVSKKDQFSKKKKRENNQVIKSKNEKINNHVHQKDKMDKTEKEHIETSLKKSKHRKEGKKKYSKETSIEKKNSQPAKKIEPNSRYTTNGYEKKIADILNNKKCSSISVLKEELAVNNIKERISNCNMISQNDDGLVRSQKRKSESNPLVTDRIPEASGSMEIDCTKTIQENMKKYIIDDDKSSERRIYAVICDTAGLVKKTSSDSGLPANQPCCEIDLTKMAIEINSPNQEMKELEPTTFAGVTCSVCMKPFESKKGLDLHWEQAESPYICPGLKT